MTPVARRCNSAMFVDATVDGAELADAQWTGHGQCSGAALARRCYVLVDAGCSRIRSTARRHSTALADEALLSQTWHCYRGRGTAFADATLLPRTWCCCCRWKCFAPSTEGKVLKATVASQNRKYRDMRNKQESKRYQLFLPFTCLPSYDLNRSLRTCYWLSSL